MNNDRSTPVAAVLHEVGEPHHTVYRIAEGDDRDLGLVVCGLADQAVSAAADPAEDAGSRRADVAVVSLDEEYAAAKPETPWPQWYAERTVEHFSAG